MNVKLNLRNVMVWWLPARFRKKYYQDNNEDALIMWSENIFDKKYKDLYNELKKLVE